MKQFNGFKIFVADKIHPLGLSMLRKSGFTVIEKYGLSNTDLIAFIEINTANKDAFSCLIIRSVRNISEKEVKKLSDISIKTICTASSGFDNIPIKACKMNSIRILNVPYGNYISAAEHTIALLLNILKNINKSDKDMKTGDFNSLRYVNYELSGKTVGIIGVGRVGSHVAKICKTFGAKVIGNDIKKTLTHIYKWIEFKELDELLKISDIVSLHIPLDSATKNLLTLKKLALMKNNSIILNCARGGIINEQALINMLKNKKIYYAGMDVYENEPYFKKEFTKLENVILDRKSVV